MVLLGVKREEVSVLRLVIVIVSGKCDGLECGSEYEDGCEEEQKRSLVY